ncbi:hypothetical protein HII31_08284 [Pseudocercospora fuligena]|uniref:NAD-dependent epimerase/dehydratase domain-containing protein n=1 Tax=Pseudocercospora fuligena TaxID=685502 RepID=A0A8H6RD56_9PEZI|nr:hypothetical protein HII31_08284 [Pseudocercospora fuligena]
MRVFLTGANGFIGLPTIRELVNRGHQVLALTRSDAGETKILSSYSSSVKAITIVRGSTEDCELITKSAAKSEGVIHLAYNHDFVGTDRATAAKQDDAVLDALLAGLRQNGGGIKKPLVVAGGCAGLRPASLLKPGLATLEPLKETDAFEKTSARVQSNEKVVNAAGVRGIVMRLAPTVHGKGDPNFVTAMKAAIVKHRRATYLGDGTNRWPATHVDDTAAALVLALEKDQRGYLHPIAEAGVAFKDIVEAIGASLGLEKAESVGEDEFKEQYGWMDRVLTEDRPTNGKLTQEMLGWRPKEIGLVQDIKENY